MSVSTNQSVSLDRWRKMEFNRYGITPALLLIQSCLASISVCYILEGSDTEQLISLSLVSFSTMAANAGIIMLLPMRWILGFFSISVILSILTLAYALL